MKTVRYAILFLTSLLALAQESRRMHYPDAFLTVTAPDGGQRSTPVYSSFLFLPEANKERLPTDGLQSEGTFTFRIGGKDGPKATLKWQFLGSDKNEDIYAISAEGPGDNRASGRVIFDGKVDATWEGKAWRVTVSHKKPNKAPGPTPGSVTPRAKESASK